MPEIIVQKYGGSSLADPEKVKAVAKRIIETRKTGKKVVVVVSAMGKSTNKLIETLEQVNPTPPDREYDALVSTGENISAAIMAAAIQELGYPSISLSGPQAGIYTEGAHKKAKISSIDVSRIQKELHDDKIVIITGFQGLNKNGDITTIGRSGSDASAVAIAVALKAKFCEIYTDVDGVYTTDPRLAEDARKIERLSHDEMLELASLGAMVLHPRAVEIGKIHNTDIVVRNSHNREEGTLVTHEKIEKDSVVTGVAFDKNASKISLLKVPDKPGIAATLFKKLAESSINVDMIVQSTHEEINHNDISFTVSKDDYRLALDICSQVGKQLNAGDVLGDEDVAKVSIVGVGMISTPGIAAEMFRILGENNINIDMISTSEIKVSCIIAKEDMEKAVKALNKELAA